MPSELLNFLKELEIDIEINEERASPQIEIDFEICSVILMFTINFLARRTASKEKRFLKKTILYMYLYVFLYPREIVRFTGKNSNNILSEVESENNLSDIIKIWKYFEMPYVVLKGRGFVIDQGMNEVSITESGEAFFDSVLKNANLRNSFSEQLKVFRAMEQSKIKIRNLGK